jgi:light-regulated signal transduction histidine kinase (bacteriophytochrome)
LVRTEELIGAFLTLSRASFTELIRDSVDLSVHARAIIERLRMAEPHRDVVIDVASPIPAYGDSRLLVVVLDNLLGNAWKFTAQITRAHITVGVDATKKPPAYFVRDDGAGFEMAIVDKLLGVHSRHVFAGKGIGLATTQRIVRRHGGTIWAEANVDRGATFYFTLEPGAGHSGP